MKITTHLLQRLGIALVATAFVVGVAATSAQARPHSLSGNARFQIGNGLPIPITLAPAPKGPLAVPPGAIVHETTGVDPKKMIIPAGGFSNPNGPKNQPVFFANTMVFQVRTNINVVGGALTLSAGGRTGASTVTFCPGTTLTGGGFGCANAAAGIIPGLMRYTKTAAQFGGANAVAPNVSGSANVALRVAGTPPGTVTAIFAIANPAPTGAQGAAFGFSNMTVPPIPGTASGVGKFKATALGGLTSVISSGLGAGLPNPATSWGGPWTTGMLTVSQPLATETFVFSGSDGRVSGIGPISLVSGAVSARTLSGPNANRGWLNFVVGPVTDVPALPVPGLVAAFGLLAMAGGYALRRVRAH